MRGDGIADRKNSPDEFTEEERIPSKRIEEKQ
jgi:hypothetical protein